MGDSRSRGYELEEERRLEKCAKEAEQRKERVCSYNLEIAICNLLDELKRQPLSREGWKRLDRLEALWFGKEDR